jgi:hypothetical protein
MGDQAICSRMIHQLQHNSLSSPGYSWHNEDIRYVITQSILSQSPRQVM